MLYIGIQAQETVSDTILVDKLAMQDDRWTHFKYRMIVPAQSTGFDNFWYWLVKNGAGFNAEKSLTDSIGALGNYVFSQLKTYEVVESYSEKLFKKLSSKYENIDLNECQILPVGKALGCVQVYRIKSFCRTNGEKTGFELSIVYDKNKDKVLTVDDIFVPETATNIKNDFGSYFINMDVNGFCVLCGYIENNRILHYKDHLYGYLDHENDFNEDFKQSIGYSKIAENLIKNRERLEREREEKLAKELAKELEEEQKIYKLVDDIPNCDLDKNGLIEHFNTNFHWPEALKKEDYKGRFSALFIVEKDGSISEVHLRDSTFAGSPLEKEMERVIKLLPTFTPGRFTNKPVRTRMQYYFSFNQKSPNGIKYKGKYYNKVVREEESEGLVLILKGVGNVISFFTR